MNAYHQQWDEDEYFWRQGIVCCIPANDDWMVSPFAQSIDKPPHDKCPYILEHLMAGQKSC
jgi:hypothetical protein